MRIPEKLPPAYAFALQVASAAVIEKWQHRTIRNSPKLAGEGLLFVVQGLFLNLDVGDGPISDKLEPLRQFALTAGIPSTTIVRAPFGATVTAEPFRAPNYYGSSSVQLRDWAARSTQAVVHYATARGSHATRLRQAHSESRFDEQQLWAGILDDIQPGAIVGITLPAGLCAAANARSLATMEVQHGLPFPDDVWIERLHDVPLTHRPSHFLTWDRVYNRTARELGMTGVTIGYPWLEAANDPAQPTSEESGEILPTLRPGNRLLVTLQYHFADSVDPYGMMSTRVGEALAALRAFGSDILLRFRLHPIWWQRDGANEAIAWLRTHYPGCEVSVPRNSPILDDIRLCDAVLTDHSSTVFESALVGVPSFVVKPGSDGRDSSHGASTATGHEDQIELPRALGNSGLFVEATVEGFPELLVRSIQRGHEPYRPDLDTTFTELVEGELLKDGA